ncbi:hypothetical protein SAY86_022019 [Trapa natans]|uniref:Uncharacterized protein n=1 Tax=Trapa natans TaxID=22666 RepID=A0AAN7MLD2_TRANT|nr:hypothetical protein SAY86_022019 [Trapa natans]
MADGLIGALQILHPGASVAVECRHGPTGRTFRQEAKTNNQGEFSVNLPFSVGKHVRKINSCSVELIGSNQPFCSVASSSLHLQSRRQGTHIFSAGLFTFKPLKQPNTCNGPSVEVNSNKGLIPPPPLKEPTTKPQSAGLLVPLPSLPILPPLPQLPPLPSLPSFPKRPPSLPRKTTIGRNLNSGSNHAHTFFDQKPVDPEFFFPPSTFQQPSFPTYPFQPPPAPLIPLPPIQGLTPTMPPPAMAFPFPPFTFPPFTPFPGIDPPAISSSPSSSYPPVASSP